MIFCSSDLILTKWMPPFPPLQLLTVVRLRARSALPSLSSASGRSSSLPCSPSKGSRQEMMTVRQMAKEAVDLSKKAMWKALPCQPCLPLPFCKTRQATTMLRCPMFRSTADSVGTIPEYLMQHYRLATRQSQPSQLHFFQAVGTCPRPAVPLRKMPLHVLSMPFGWECSCEMTFVFPTLFWARTCLCPYQQMLSILRNASITYP